jgi:hypothetical protein
MSSISMKRVHVQEYPYYKKPVKPIGALVKVAFSAASSGAETRFYVK